MAQKICEFAFRAHHGTYTAKEISENLQLTADIEWSVGQPKITKTGRKLNGVYKESFCLFKIAKTKHTFIEGIKEFKAIIETRKQLMKAFTDSGGKLDIYIVYEAEDTFGEELEWPILLVLAEHKIDLLMSVIQVE